MKYVNNSILVVDDNEMNRDMLIRRLERQGYTVAGAEGGKKALELMTVENFDLVLLDIMMPDLDGFEVLERMKKKDKLRDVPVIMLTAVNEAKNVIRCIEMGANDYIVKPFDMVALRNRIMRALLNRRIRSEVDDTVDWTGGEAPSVLVVEDDEMSRALLTSRINRAGYQVTEAGNGQHALDILENKPDFDLVLLDIMMPGVDGFTVLEKVKKDKRLDTVPVIMISALDDQSSIDRCMQMGAEDYITKPFNALILKSRVLSCVQSKLISDRDREQRSRLEELAKEGEEIRKN
jgi:DNA-binding response OmpR family regulator